ncbi:MAG: NAD-dependent epimerase/dehydratase family protein, partial [Asgard group archaeon]|nr:NAD-dependent epimerase/dehydratase family protein [Asgard group archaeon]
MLTSKNTLITGVTGQDGAYLAKLLIEKGYSVYGTYRRLSTPNFWRLQALDIFDRIHLIPIDLSDFSSLLQAIQISQPDELYHLAAQSFVGASFEQPVATCEVSGLATTRLLELIRCYRPETKFYQASSSEMFGNAHPQIQNEDTPFSPQSPYAVAKLYA